MNVIYQIHDFCVNNCHYRNDLVDGDYHWCNHYQTSVTACEAAAASVHNWSGDLHRIDGGCNVMTLRSRLTYFDDGNVDEIEVEAVELPVDSKIHSENVAKLAPGDAKAHVIAHFLIDKV